MPAGWTVPSDSDAFPWVFAVIIAFSRRGSVDVCVRTVGAVDVVRRRRAALVCRVECPLVDLIRSRLGWLLGWQRGNRVRRRPATSLLMWGSWRMARCEEFRRKQLVAVVLAMMMLMIMMMGVFDLIDG